MGELGTYRGTGWRLFRGWIRKREIKRKRRRMVRPKSRVLKRRRGRTLILLLFYSTIIVDLFLLCCNTGLFSHYLGCCREATSCERIVLARKRVFVVASSLQVTRRFRVLNDLEIESEIPILLSKRILFSISLAKLTKIVHLSNPFPPLPHRHRSLSSLHHALPSLFIPRELIRLSLSVPLNSLTESGHVCGYCFRL